MRQTFRKIREKQGEKKALKRLVEIKERRKRAKRKTTKKQAPKSKPKKSKSASKQNEEILLTEGKGHVKEKKKIKTCMELAKVEKKKEPIVIDEDSIQRVHAVVKLIGDEVSDDFITWLITFGRQQKKDPVDYLLKGGKPFLKAMKQRFAESEMCKKNRFLEQREEEKKKHEAAVQERFDVCQTECETTYKSAKSNWSQQQRRSWANRKKSPCSFFYRHSKQTEGRKDNQSWEHDEYVAFVESLKIFGANQQWGLFSYNVPGRCGYVCSNKYRDLLKSGYVYEPNYTCGKCPKMTNYASENGREDYYFRKYFAFIVLEDPSGTLQTPWCHPLSLMDTKQKCMLAAIKRKAFEYCQEN